MPRNYYISARLFPRLNIVLIFILITWIFPPPGFALDLNTLWQLPSPEAAPRIARTYIQDGVKVSEVYYPSRPYKGKTAIIFGYYCVPLYVKEKQPAILISHGGGGSASLQTGLRWARYGYANLVIDLPGKGKQREASRSTGPDMDVENLLYTGKDLENNYLIHSVAAIRNGISFLAGQPEVDPERIGMIGLSWGGVNALLTNGQEPKLKAVVNVFGAGFIPEGCTWMDQFTKKSPEEMGRWHKYIDPSRFLATQNAPILFITGTNDHCYYLPTFQKSYLKINGEKQLCLVPNLRHQFYPRDEKVALAWLNSKLKNTGTFPEVTILPFFEEKKPYLMISNKLTMKEPKLQRAPDYLTIPVMTDSRADINNLVLYYSAGGPNQWTIKKWHSLKANYGKNGYFFKIPHRLIDPEILFFTSITDLDGRTSSSLARSLFKMTLENGEQTYAVSPPLTRTFKHDLPMTLLNGEKIRSNSYLVYSPKTKSYLLFSKKMRRAERSLFRKWLSTLKIWQIGLLAR
ncbi:MAG: acetylxylan esterase [Candidatus Margulisbacteria bacterium]|nr:acetylxylan esterase [Candidatus Margulisiibacteriota bacterium]